MSKQKLGGNFEAWVVTCNVEFKYGTGIILPFMSLHVIIASFNYVSDLPLAVSAPNFCSIIGIN